MLNSASSQFSLMHNDSPHLDGQYAALGKVIEGMEVVNEIAETKTGRHNRPVESNEWKQ
ncbi:MAG: peptidylprolyl isomerase [Bacillota bacterium]|nr:peptidylprolyl isomerase [Bacillota bacterium]